MLSDRKKNIRMSQTLSNFVLASILISKPNSKSQVQETVYKNLHKYLFIYIKILTPSFQKEIKRISKLSSLGKGGDKRPPHFQNSSKKFFSHRFRVIEV